jgi:hypothetical protein
MSDIAAGLVLMEEVSATATWPDPASAVDSAEKPMNWAPLMA